MSAIAGLPVGMVYSAVVEYYQILVSLPVSPPLRIVNR